MKFPQITDEVRLARLEPPCAKVRMVLDTDTCNEVDDQFALVHALLSPGRVELEAIHAAPFHNSRSSGPADGMAKSYEEILRVLKRIDIPGGVVCRGCTAYLDGVEAPEQSDAGSDLIERAMQSGGGQPLYVVAIGAATNVASAMLIEPEIVEHIVVVWLGGHALQWPTNRDAFNLAQDPAAARVLFDSGVPLVHLPCLGVCSHMVTTVAELEHFVAGRGVIGDYLCGIVRDYGEDVPGWSKVIWDLAATAYAVDPGWIRTDLVSSPVLTDELTWAADPGRHLIRNATYVDRDAIFGDLFRKLDRNAP